MRWTMSIMAVTALCLSVKAQGVPSITIIPNPTQVKVHGGTFTLNAGTDIVASRDLSDLGHTLVNLIAPATGWQLPVRQTTTRTSNIICLSLSPELAHLTDEGYQLSVTPDQIKITASGQTGLFYGMQTLRQLLPPECFSAEPVSGVAWTVPCVEIEDTPRFSWRGMHLDCCRYFMPTSFVKKYIDLLALHKMNRFHWHLTEDQGWRIEIKAYPRLTEVGAWRDQSLIGHAGRPPLKYDGVRHGGFYSQADIREIVAYAKARFVTIVPEIEMPGHAQAAIAAYPELGCTDQKLPVFTEWGVNPNILNPFPATIRFMQAVLTETLDLFDSEFIHIGGDEAPKTQWEHSPQVQARMKALGIESEDGLQSWFIHQMDTFLAQRGRRLIGWDEILEGGLAPGATVMSWRGEAGGIAAAKAGHDVVMTPTPYTYLDYYQGPPEKEPLAIGGNLTWQKVYSYNPIPKVLTPDQAKHILGVQGQIWTEYIPTPKHAEYMAFPRACALSEVAWTPLNLKDEADFKARLTSHLKRLDQLHVNYHPLDKP